MEEKERKGKEYYKARYILKKKKRERKEKEKEKKIRFPAPSWVE